MSDIPNLEAPQKTHKLVTSIPAYLKKPESYEKVQKLIYETLASTHSHGEVIEWAQCAACQRRFAERGVLLKRLGFKHPSQYVIWRRIHEIMRGNYKKDPLKKYNDPD